MNRKIFITLTASLLVTTFFTSCGVRNGNTKQQTVVNPTTFNEGVVINGVRWATHNVGRRSRRFARNPESAGGFFTFEEAQNACPCGWRLPTREELQLLVETDRGWITRNGVNGRLFGTTPNDLFLPAAGFRSTDGALNRVGALGDYWSSSASDAGNGWHLFFYSSSSGVNDDSRLNGFSVRCVSE